MKKLPAGLASAMIKAKTQMMLKMVGAIIGIGLLIWMMIKNPALAKKIGTLFVNMIKMVGKMIIKVIDKMGPIAIGLVSAIAAIIGLIYFRTMGINCRCGSRNHIAHSQIPKANLGWIEKTWVISLERSKINNLFYPKSSGEIFPTE